MQSFACCFHSPVLFMLAAVSQGSKETVHILKGKEENSKISTSLNGTYLCNAKVHAHNLPFSLSFLSVQSTFLQIVFNYNICNSIKHKLHILGVSGTGEMRINFLGVFSSVQIFKLALDVCSSFFIRIRT